MTRLSSSKTCLVNRSSLAIPAVFLIASCCLSSFGSAVPAQEAGYNDIFQQAPSDIRRPINSAIKAIEEERFSDAVLQLGALLMSESGDLAERQDYFLEAATGGASLKSKRLKAEAQDLIANLPPAGREIYELQFGAQARALLSEAIAEGSMAKLAEVTRKFLHTEAGYEAAVLAGRYELASGHPIAAALCFQRVASSPAARRFEPELSLLLATCWYYADMTDKAKDTLVSLKSRFPQAALEFNGKKIDLFAKDDQALEWLKGIVGDRRSLRSPVVTEWVMFRGDGHRNGSTNGSLPLMNYRWYVPTYIDHEDEKLILKMAKQYRDSSTPALPAFQPLAIGDTILMRTPRKLLGVDFKTGKRVWVWPWDDEAVGRETYLPTSSTRSPTSDTREVELRQRLWDDAAHGQMSSNGEFVFYLHELGYANASNGTTRRVFIGPGGVQRNYPGAPRSTNQLVAVSLKSQGKLQWIVGGESGEEEPKLAGAFFLGPPLPLDDQLYALAEFNGEIRLVVLAQKSGQLQWQQQLAHVDTLTIVNDGTRRLAGATPSHSGGVLICPTSAGAVVAVDLATRSLLWGHQYTPAAKQPVNHGFAFRAPRSRPPKDLGRHWQDATPVIADGRVLVTPVEAAAEWDKLYCFDLLTGKEVWPAVDRDDRLFIACVHDGAAVIVGPEDVTAVKLSNGKPAWDSAVSLEGLPSGRGFYSDKYYFLPTTGSELLKIDVAEGKIVGRTRTSHVLGNLLCHRNEVISQGVDRLATFYQGDPLRGVVAARLQADPKDPWALARHGELLLQDGKQNEAVATLRRAFELDPTDDSTRMLLVTTLLAGLKEDFAAYEEHTDEIAKLIDLPQQRTEFLRLMAVGWQESGEIAQAFDAYLDLAHLKGELPGEAGTAEFEVEHVQKHLNVRIDRWLQARFAELLDAASPEDRERMTASIERFYDEALTGTRIADIRRFVRYFGRHRLADAVRLQLARRLIEAGEALEAELVLTRLVETGDQSLLPQATATLAQLLRDIRQFEPASRYFVALGEQWPDTVCANGKTGKQLMEEAIGDRLIAEALARREPWPYGATKVTEDNDTRNRHPNYRRVYSSSILQRSGSVPTGLNVAYDQTANALVITDGWGKTLTQLRLSNVRLSTSDYSLTHARANGHLLLVSTGMEILAIDVLQAMKNPSEGVLWRRQLLHQSPSTSVYQLHVRVKTLEHPLGGSRRVFTDTQNNPIGATGPLWDSGVCYINGRELVCADPLTGNTVWARDSLPLGCDVFGDRDLIFVVPQDSDEATVLSSVDGRELGRRKVGRIDNRWANFGRNTLTWQRDPQDNSIALRLFDAWSGDTIWEEKLDGNTKACLVDHNEVAFLEPSGRLRIRSLEDAAIRIEDQLDAEPTLSSLHVLRSQTQYIVATNRPFTPEPGAPQVYVQSTGSGQNNPLITGNVYAFDRSSAKRDWQVPAAIERFGFPVDQPSEVPLLFFMRQLRESNSRSRVATKTSILCLDRRDGRIVYENDAIPTQTYTYDILADRVKNSVTVAVASRLITIDLTDQPRPPSPPAQTGTASSLTHAGRRSVAGDVAKAILRTLGGIDPFSKPEP